MAKNYSEEKAKWEKKYEEMAASDNVEDRLQVAYHHRLSEKSYLKLAGDSSERVRQIVAGRLALPSKVVEVLAKDDNPKVVAELVQKQRALKPKQQEAIFKKWNDNWLVLRNFAWTNDLRPEIQKHMIMNAPMEHMVHFFETRPERVDPKLTLKGVRRLAKVEHEVTYDPELGGLPLDQAVYRLLTYQGKEIEKIRSILANAKLPKIREMVAGVRGVENDLLEKLLKDEVEEVRHSAILGLARTGNIKKHLERIEEMGVDEAKRLFGKFNGRAGSRTWVKVVSDLPRRLKKLAVEERGKLPTLFALDAVEDSELREVIKETYGEAPEKRSAKDLLGAFVEGVHPLLDALSREGLEAFGEGKGVDTDRLAQVIDMLTKRQLQKLAESEDVVLQELAKEQLAKKAEGEKKKQGRKR